MIIWYYISQGDTIIKYCWNCNAIVSSALCECPYCGCKYCIVYD